MTLQQLEYMVALDTHRHFVTAAEKCFVTQPTLTIQLKKLEDELGIELFDRSKHPIEPSPAAEKIILKARTILREVKGLSELIQDEKESMKGEYKLGIIPTLAPYLLPRFLKSFSDKHPQTILLIEELKSEDLIHKLQHDQIDMAIMSTPLNENSLRETLLFQEPFVVYSDTDHPIKSSKKLNKSTLSKNDLWLLNEGHCFRNQTLKVCGNPNNNRNVKFESGSLESLKNLIDSNGGYSLFPALSIDYLLNEKEVMHFSDKTPSRDVSLVVHNGFAKETLLNELHDEINASLPDSCKKNERYIRVKWR